MRWFEIALVSLVALTGLIRLLDKYWLAPRRLARAGLLDDGKEPWLVDYAKSFFPVLLLVLLLRTFLAEPFRIPSNSMMPTLLTGDFILVNKFVYGLRLPITNHKLLALGEPERGDVVVFHSVQQDDVNLVKRVVGLPGDRVEYRDGRLTVNGEAIPAERVGTYTGVRSGAEMTGAQEWQERLGRHDHRILLVEQARRPAQAEGEWTVPAGQYFVMGDNRDNSDDSRYWGYLPERNLVGRAFLIWLNFDGGVDTARIGRSIP
ncbi:signal peptidase I [Lysobacter sp. K5869]|uniref:signal peptidase I n=1 Tax=Lysobacter sp. K5869 TaxID=2820808 RepID=UPI001C064190|nr:signal peptidase I [Lysobacter sp. K5869]QWP78368.1 signal peptidase I [Lysobacter sp. K5869]